MSVGFKSTLLSDKNRERNIAQTMMVMARAHTKKKHTQILLFKINDVLRSIRVCIQKHLFLNNNGKTSIQYSYFIEP